MNVIISNKYRQQLNTLEIEISKKPLTFRFPDDKITQPHRKGLQVLPKSRRL